MDPTNLPAGTILQVLECDGTEMFHGMRVGLYGYIILTGIGGHEYRAAGKPIMRDFCTAWIISKTHLLNCFEKNMIAIHLPPNFGEYVPKKGDRYMIAVDDWRSKPGTILTVLDQEPNQRPKVFRDNNPEDTSYVVNVRRALMNKEIYLVDGPSINRFTYNSCPYIVGDQHRGPEDKNEWILSNESQLAML